MLAGVILSHLSVCYSFRQPETMLCKTLVLALATAFSGSVAAADWAQQTSAFCHAPSAQKSAISPAQSSGGAPLAQDVTRISADKLTGQTKVRHRAQGDVIVERNQETLNADWIDYDEIQQRIQAGDVFTLSRANGQTVRGKSLDYDLNQQQGSAEQVAFEAEHEGRRLQGVSSQLQMLDKQRMAMHDVQFNTCNAGDKSWYIQAAQVQTNQATGIGVAKHARLVFGGVPVLYTPWLDFPINGNRKSGFLVPTLAVGSNGTQIDLPYYLNLAPNYDATLTPSVISARGARIGGEFRYLQPKFSGSLNGTYMPHDQRSPFKHRYEIHAQHQHRFTPHFSGSIDYHQVSDDDYYRDFYNNESIATNVNLNRQLWLDYHNTIGGGILGAQLTLKKYQTLADSIGNKETPYTLMPRLAVQWQKNIAQRGLLDITGQFSRFHHKSKQAGNRLVLYPSIKWDFHNQWAYIHPKIGLHATQYWLDHFKQQQARHTSRVLPIVNIDSGITLERETQIGSQAYLQTLEPRLFYNYIPTKKQNDLPNFDTAENDFTYEQLFRENAFSGHDRINASNSLSIGVQSRFLDRRTGQERFRIGAGQKYYFKDDNIILDGSLTKNGRKRSDFVAFAGGWLNHNWHTDTQWHWSENDSQTKSISTSLRYNPEPGKVLSLRYKYGRNQQIYSGYYDTLQHIDLGVQWPINPNLYAIGRINYSIAPSALLEKSIGLEYRNPCGCWSASLVGQRYVTGLNQYKNAFFFTLQLKNLSNIGKYPYDKLRSGIPGYTKTNEVFTR